MEEELALDVTGKGPRSSKALTNDVRDCSSAAASVLRSASGRKSTSTPASSENGALSRRTARPPSVMPLGRVVCLVMSTVSRGVMSASPLAAATTLNRAAPSPNSQELTARDALAPAGVVTTAPSGGSAGVPDPAETRGKRNP